jgi:preprotein translocase subunit SecY
MTFDTQKLIISLYAALVFFIISHEKTYGLTKSVVDIIQSKAPIINAHMVHTIVFLLIIYIMMNVQLPGIEKKTEEE